MALLVLIIGAVILTAAIRNTHPELLSAVREDVPAFALWGAAIFGLALIGFVPGLKPVSRGLLALLVLAIVLGNYKRILAAFQGVAYGAPGGNVQSGAGGDNGALMTSLDRVVATINQGGSGDYTDLFPSGGDYSSAARALAAATAAENAARSA